MKLFLGLFFGAIGGGIIGTKILGDTGFILGVIIGGIAGFLAPEIAARLFDAISYTR